jgi:hypothetical protein
MLIGMILAFAVQSTAGKPVETIAADMMSQIEMPMQVAARTPAEWSALWRKHAGETAIPKVDFGSRSVVAVFLGTRSSAGYTVEIVGTRTEKGATVVEWSERRPERDQVAAQVITSPAHIATIPRVTGDIRFEKVDR